MKKRLLIIGAALVAVAALVLIVTQILPTEKPAIPLENAEQAYSLARLSISTAPDITLKISKTREMTVGGNEFTEVSQQKMVIRGLGTDNILASATETLSIGSHSVTISEAFSDNVCYISINDSGFSCPITLDDYLKRFAYLGLLDESVYNSIAGIDDREQYVISFSQPSEAEHWALDSNYEIENASGTVYISYDGQITKSTYTLTYRIGDVQIQTSYIVDIALTAGEIFLPDNRDTFLPIDYIDGPKMLERATGYLLQANNVSSHYTDSIYFQAFGDSWTRSVTLHMANQENLSASTKTLTALKNDSRVGQDSQLSNTVLFIDNRYLESTDGDNFTINNDVSAGNMLKHCQNNLIRNIMLPENVTGAQIIESEDSIRILFSADDDFASQICASACLTLYQEPELLNDLAQSRTTDTLQCYLELDRLTTLPVASGINYSGTHNIDGIPYTLQYKNDHVYDLISQLTPEEIQKAAGY